MPVSPVVCPKEPLSRDLDVSVSISRPITEIATDMTMICFVTPDVEFSPGNGRVQFFSTMKALSAAVPANSAGLLGRERLLLPRRPPKDVGGGARLHRTHGRRTDGRSGGAFRPCERHGRRVRHRGERRAGIRLRAVFRRHTHHRRGRGSPEHGAGLQGRHRCGIRQCAPTRHHAGRGRRVPRVRCGAVFRHGRFRAARAYVRQGRKHYPRIHAGRSGFGDRPYPDGGPVLWECGLRLGH